MYHIDMIYTIGTLIKKGYSQRGIAKHLGISRKTVKKYFLQTQADSTVEPLTYRPKILEQYKEDIKEWIMSDISSRIIYERLISAYSVDVSYPTVARFVKVFKKSEVFVPLLSKPGEEAQVDFGYLGRFKITDKEVKVWCFVMTLSFSRLQYVELVTNQSVNSFLISHQYAFEYFGGVPQTVKIDNLKAGVLLPNFYESIIQNQYAEFLSHYQSMPITARVRRPQDKGKVESGVKFVKNNFLKSLVHRNLNQAKNELILWVEKANQRIHGTTKKIPVEQFQHIEKQNLISLPDHRFELYYINRRKVNNYAHIVFENNYYSVPADYASKDVIIKYNQSTLKVFDNQTQIAIHAIDKGIGNFITQQHHAPIGKQYKNKEYYLEKAAKIGPYVVDFLNVLIEKKPYEYQRSFNGICHLAKIYDHQKVNLACKRSLAFGAISYLSV